MIAHPFKWFFRLLLSLFVAVLPSEISFAASGYRDKALALYQMLHRQAPSLPGVVLHQALQAYLQAKQAGLVHKPVLTVIDFAYRSTQKRLWTFDLSKKPVRLVYYTYVAHGRNSGGIQATHFSNRIDSKQSSLGLFVTGRAYQGHLGYALRLEGVEPGINDNAAARAIVIHGAPYVSRQFIKRTGRLGRSWGCPAVDQAIIHPFVDLLKGGSVVFSYFPDNDWLAHSHYV